MLAMQKAVFLLSSPLQRRTSRHQPMCISLYMPFITTYKRQLEQHNKFCPMMKGQGIIAGPKCPCYQLLEVCVSFLVICRLKATVCTKHMLTMHMRHADIVPVQHLYLVRVLLDAECYMRICCFMLYSLMLSL